VAISGLCWLKDKGSIAYRQVVISGLCWLDDKEGRASTRKVSSKGSFAEVDLSGLLSILIGTGLRPPHDVKNLTAFRNEGFHCAAAKSAKRRSDETMNEIGGEIRGLFGRMSGWAAA